MSDAGSRVQEAFVDAYEPYVRSKIVALGVGEVEGLAGAIEAGRAWLAKALADLVDTPFAQQSRGPLELFQESMQFPTEALISQGVESSDRDEIAANALPGDLYQLAPAASHEIGEAAWHAHLAWGVAKVAAMVAPVSRLVGVLSRNLMDSSKLSAALTAAGFEIAAIRGDGLPDDLGTVIVDLEHPAAEAVVAAAVDRKIRCAAYGPHTDQALLKRALELGATEALARSQILVDPAAFAAKLRDGA
jgi:hypothetical protein